MNCSGDVPVAGRSNRFVAEDGDATSTSHPLARDQVIPSLALAHNRSLPALDQNLRRQPPRIVIRRHDESVGTGAEQCDAVTRADRRQLAILREKITALANRSDHVDRAA
jgi:hypothetical protein